MMDALTALHDRVSSSRMTQEEPAPEALEPVFRAALRAADHALLRPWRFLVIRGEGRQRLGDLFADTLRSEQSGMSEAKLDKTRGKALRAPVIVVAISSPRPHPKVPVFEQELSTGAAVQNMLNAAYAQELGAIWRTGPMAEAAQVRDGLGLEEQERIIGFLYLGYTDGPQRPAPHLAVDEFFREWPAQ
ncbi:MAG: nitroreductase [Pseudohongiellaceae bacterium]